MSHHINIFRGLRCLCCCFNVCLLSDLLHKLSNALCFIIIIFFFFFRSKSKIKVKEPKRKQASSSKASTTKKVRRAPEPSGWGLESDSDEEVAVKKAPALQSVLTRRVADGILRRTGNFEGDTFIDLKIYNVKDIINIDPKDRWEKAVVSLKFQAHSDSPELGPLKTVLQYCKGQFREGRFFTSK